MKCFLCNKSDFEVVYNLKTRKIIRCQNDGLFLAQDQFKDKYFYDKNYFDLSPYPSSINKNYFLNKLRKIIEITGEKKPSILDIGCGWGNFLELLKEKNIPYLGIDTSPEAIKICSQKKLNCRQIDVETLVSENKNKYSSITCFQVIEHLENPLIFLKSIKKLLKKNRVIIMTTPNNNSPLRKIFGQKWSVYNIKSHFVFYDKETLKKTLTMAGFKNINIKTDNIRFLSLGYIFSRLFNVKLPIANYLPILTDRFGDLEIILKRS